MQVPSARCEVHPVRLSWDRCDLIDTTKPGAGMDERWSSTGCTAVAGLPEQTGLATKG